MKQSVTKISALFVFASLWLLFSCKPQVPSKYLQPDEMEDILFDFHLALAMEQGRGSGAGIGQGNDPLVNEFGDFSPVGSDVDGYRSRLLEAAVLKNHGVSEAEFDSSVVYYTRHSDRFQQIYENISKRLSDEAMALGASASDISNLGENFSSGDTANVWKEMPSKVLTTTAISNVLSFSIKADTAYHKGDKLMLSFDTQFIIQDGTKDAVAMLAVTFQNDSVATRVVHMQSSENYSLSISDDDRIGIKGIKGFISLQNRREETQTTLKLLFLQNIRLIRCHQKEQPAMPAKEEVGVKADTLPTETKPINNENTQNSVQQGIPRKPVVRPVRSGSLR